MSLLLFNGNYHVWSFGLDMRQIESHVVGAVGGVGVFMRVGVVAMVTMAAVVPVLVEQHRRVLVGAAAGAAGATGATGAAGATGPAATASVQFIHRHFDRTVGNREKRVVRCR